VRTMTRAVAFGLACLALALFTRTMTPSASAQEVTARDADGKRPATLQEIRAFLRDLAEVSEDLGVVQNAVASGDPALVAPPADAEWRWDECRFQSVNRPLWTANEERLTAECATDKWSIPGGLAELTSVGQCESGWNRFANNGGRYVGLFQHAASSYTGRVNTYGPVAWDHPISTAWRNSRSQIVMTVRMVRDVGWGPWSCA